MHKYYIVSLFAVLISTSAANANTSVRDSIGVENHNGKKLIIHQVVAKDNYFAIGRRYDVKPKDIMAFNENRVLQIGSLVKVPTDIPFKTEQATPKPPVSNSTPTKPSSTRSTNADNNEPSGDENLIEHNVERKENLNMLAQKYGTTINEIKRVNHMNSINLRVGQVLKIPAKNVPAEQPADTSATERPTTSSAVVPIFPKRDRTAPPVNQEVPAAPRQIPTQTTPTDSTSEELLTHIVASNETIYSIATRYKLTMDQLKAKNNLKDNSLTVGQKLLIRGQYPVAKPTPVPNTSTPVNPADTLNSIKDPSLRLPASRYGLNQVDEKGTAVWIADPDLDPSKMLVLHRTAPIGTVMKITNPMSNRSTFAKVVGKFTENESTKDVIIVMTKAVADALGALDKRFFCNLTYGGQDNE